MEDDLIYFESTDVWRPIPGIEKYEVSEEGVVRHAVNKNVITMLPGKGDYAGVYKLKNSRDETVSFTLRDLLRTVFGRTIWIRNGVDVSDLVEGMTDWTTFCEFDAYEICREGLVRNIETARVLQPRGKAQNRIVFFRDGVANSFYIDELVRTIFGEEDSNGETRIDGASEESA